VLNLGKLSEVRGLNTVVVLVENWWYSHSLFLLLMSLLIRYVAELEVSFWKSDKILPPSVLLQRCVFCPNATNYTGQQNITFFWPMNFNR